MFIICFNYSIDYIGYEMLIILYIEVCCREMECVNCRIFSIYVVKVFNYCFYVCGIGCSLFVVGYLILILYEYVNFEFVDGFELNFYLDFFVLLLLVIVLSYGWNVYFC